MSAAKDPFEIYLKQASDLFDAGDVVRAGQIWQAILKKAPGHEVARAGLYRVKLYFDARATQDGLANANPVLAVIPDAPTPSTPLDPEVTRLLEEGCTLYDAGQVKKAIEAWEQVLRMDSENAMAKGYINGAMRAQILGPEEEEEGGHSGAGVRDTTDYAQDLPASPAPEVPPAPEPPAVISAPEPPKAPAAPEVDVEQLLRDGCTLYDMGQVEDALKKWERALIAEPGHALARSYIKDARKDLGLPPLEDNAIPATASPEAQAPAASSSSAPPDDERLEQLIREGVQLFDMGMSQEAAAKWKQVLEAAPDHRDAKTYLAMAEKELEKPTEAPTRKAPAAPVARPLPALTPAPPPVQISLESISLSLPEPEPQGTDSAEASAAAVAPPKALTAPKESATRKGLALPAALQSFSLPAWFNSPLLILGSIIGVVVLIVGFILYRSWRKDVALRDTVAARVAEAMAPVARSAQIISLDETPEALRREAQQALDEDPLVAYYRAQELLRRNPSDSEAAELLERCKGNMAGAAASTAPTLADYERQRQDGDLDSANTSITQLLLLNPDDPALKERAANLVQALAQIHAAKERWEEAEGCLKRGRALMPEDKSWNARLLLLQHIQKVSRAERATWLQLLG
jgi:tetratricopeptide (TPR) repeat protein